MFIYFLYRLLSVLAFPLILLYILRRGFRDHRYWRQLGERFGGPPLSFDATVPGGIWLHAVSVGEVVSAVELLRQLRLAFPMQQLFVSVTTVAGRQIAEEKLSGAADAIFYVPLDFCWAVRRVLRRLRPQLLVVMETEIWPNLYRETKRFGCGLVIVNGRISDRAFPAYCRWKWAFQPVLQLPDAILAQNEIAAERYLELGAPSGRVVCNGNLKYDFRVSGLRPPAAVQQLCDRLQPSAIWIAASTMPPFLPDDPDEDSVVLDAFQSLAQQHPRLLLFLVPRRPERFEEAALKLERAKIPFLRRSQLTEDSEIGLPAVLLVDSMGELGALFPLATVVFMGGTLPRRGGHNILEPAFFGKPVIIGPRMENFPDIAAEFLAGEAVYRIESATELAPAVGRLLGNPAEAAFIGANAKRLTEAKRGATARAIAVIRESYAAALPRRVRPWIWMMIFWPLSKIWIAGLRLDQRRKQKRLRRLKTPVISIGGVAMGGTGKTPMVAYLAEWLAASGLRPAVLTRGYKRGSSDKHLLLPAGEACPVCKTGDEAQLLLRRGHAILGIGADRYDTGRHLEQAFQPGVMLLDDGFQHWSLARDADLVLLDAQSPFAGGEVFPLGRLREPLEGLRRASAFIITRTAMPTPWTVLETQLHSLQPAAPIFYSSVEPIEWVSFNGAERYPPQSLPGGSSAAFCGLGNPGSFWGTLHALDIHPVFRWAFGDHQSYRLVHLRRLAHHAKAMGASRFLTTEKDVMNLPADAEDHLSGCKIFWLRTRMNVHQEAEFLQWMAECIDNLTKIDRS